MSSVTIICYEHLARREICHTVCINRYLCRDSSSYFDTGDKPQDTLTRGTLTSDNYEVYFQIHEIFSTISHKNISCSTFGICHPCRLHLWTSRHHRLAILVENAWRFPMEQNKSREGNWFVYVSTYSRVCIYIIDRPQYTLAWCIVNRKRSKASNSVSNSS